MHTRIDQNWDFYGAHLGVGAVYYELPGTDVGFILGWDAFFAPGWLRTRANARQDIVCGVCNPAIDTSVFGGFGETEFSALFGGSAYFGYRFCPYTKLKFFGEIDHMTNVAYLHNPISPNEQPVRLRKDSITNYTFGLRGSISFSLGLEDTRPPPP